MLLYHGTSLQIAARVAREGLRPRSLSQHQGHWKKAPSNPDFVYLSTVYAPYYSASSHGDNEIRKMVLIEVDHGTLHEDLLRPDEDFLEQATRASDGNLYGENAAQRVQWYRDNIHDFANPSNVAASLKHLGNVAYAGEITPDKIVRFILIPVEGETGMRLLYEVVDGMVSIQNHRYLNSELTQRMSDILNGKIENTEFLSLAEFSKKYSAIE